MADDLERETTELLQLLVRTNTVNPPGNERPAQEHLAKLLADAGFDVVQERVITHDEPGHGPVSFMWVLARRER